MQESLREPWNVASTDSAVADLPGERRVNDDDTEIGWHREQIAKNRVLIEELETANAAGGEVFPETQAELERLKSQMEQSELIVAAYEKKRLG